MRNRHSILFILPSFSGGGAERVILNLLIGLHNRGIPVGIIVFETSGPLLSMVPNGVSIYNLDKVSLKRSIIPLIKKLNQLHPKVVFSTLGYINVALLSVRWMLFKRTSIWVREANLPSISLSNNLYPKIMVFLYRVLYKYADKVICTSVRMKSEFKYDFLVPDDIIEVLPNPVDVQKIRRLAFPTIRFDKGGVCYIAAGRPTFQKGFDRLLYWFSELENKKSTLAILGEGELKNELIKEVELLNIQDRVKFLGFCNNPWQWYAGADVFLLPSRWEGMSNSVLEALVCGTPVVATKESGGIKEIAITAYNYNAITVVNNGQQFIEIMNQVEIRDVRGISNSLLPSRYRMDKIVSTIEDWLNDIA